MFQNNRTDNWWFEPVLTATGFLSFVIYTTWRAFSGSNFVADNYLSPFYSPLLFSAPENNGIAEGSHHAWFGDWPSIMPEWIPESPALFILIFPLHSKINPTKKLFIRLFNCYCFI